MERNQVDERQAFEMLRQQARQSGQKLVHVAQAVLDGHLLLRGGPSPPPGSGDDPRASPAAETERRGAVWLGCGLPGYAAARADESALLAGFCEPGQLGAPAQPLMAETRV